MMNKKKLVDLLIPLVVWLALLAIPVPHGLKPFAWYYFAIFATVRCAVSQLVLVINNGQRPTSTVPAYRGAFRLQLFTRGKDHIYVTFTPVVPIMARGYTVV